MPVIVPAVNLYKMWTYCLVLTPRSLALRALSFMATTNSSKVMPPEASRSLLPNISYKTS